ncbi:MAG: hypothetical protein AAGD88_13395 [Bacteroidota bacterium]
MKYLSLLFLRPTFFSLTFLASFVLIIGCGDDEGGNATPSDEAELIGIYDLVEINVSQSLDIDTDGNSSSNLLDEVPCITGTLTLGANNQWSVEQSNVSVTTITGGLFFADCSGTVSTSGTWTVSSGTVQFSGGTLLTTAIRSQDRLISTIGDDLPGIQSYAYQRR